MRRLLVVLLVALGLVALTGAGVYVRDRLVGAQAELTIARAQAATARANAQRAQDAGSALQQRADSAEQRRDSAERRATALQRQYAADKARLGAAAAAAPDTCSQIIDAALAALSDADSVHQADSTALSSSQEAARSLQLRGDTLATALQALRVSSAALDAAAGHVASAVHVSLLSRVLPRVGYGLAAGVDQLGQPHLIVGVTVGWSF